MTSLGLKLATFRLCIYIYTRISPRDREEWLAGLNKQKIIFVDLVALKRMIFDTISLPIFPIGQVKVLDLTLPRRSVGLKKNTHTHTHTHTHTEDLWLKLPYIIPPAHNKVFPIYLTTFHFNLLFCYTFLHIYVQMK
jgi:hypothetical protein